MLYRFDPVQPILVNVFRERSTAYKYGNYYTAIVAQRLANGAPNWSFSFIVNTDYHDIAAEAEERVGYWLKHEAEEARQAVLCSILTAVAECYASGDSSE